MSQLSFYPEEWEEFLENIDFTDEERQIISLIRRGWYQEDITDRTKLCKTNDCKTVYLNHKQNSTLCFKKQEIGGCHKCGTRLFFCCSKIES